MKWTVAMVAVVVGVAGVCRADDARRDFDNRSRCFAPDGAVSPEQRRESCTAVIESPGQTRQALVVAYDNRGIHYSRKGEYDRAIPDFDEAIRLDPKFAQAYNNRGIAYNNKGSYDHAIADFDEAIRLNPKFTLAYYNRGLSYGRKGELNRAIADLDEAIRLNPKYSAAYNSRGFVYASKGDYARAIADYDQALTLDPSLAVARQNRERAQAAIATPPEQTAPAPSGPERRVALVIGNSAYRSEAFLPNPRRDAKAVADALRQTGFQSVDLKMDLDRDGMVKALRAFRDQADKADWALIYFAGHGIEINRINYLVPVDAKLLDDRDVKAETVSYEELLDAAGGARTLRLLVLDACRVNPFKDSMRRTLASRGSTDRGLAPPPEPEAGTIVVYSAKDGQVAADDADGVNSPFARAFVSELKVPGLEVRRLFDNVRDDVLDVTKRRQQPFTYGSLSGRRDFYFLAKMNPPSQPPRPTAVAPVSVASSVSLPSGGAAQSLPAPESVGSETMAPTPPSYTPPQSPPSHAEETAAAAAIKPIHVQTAKVKMAPAQVAALAPARAASRDSGPPTATTPAPASEEPPRARDLIAETVRATTPPESAARLGAPAAPPVHSGWIIQVGAFDSEREARDRLNAVQAKVGEKLQQASPFTEAVVAGDKTLYRARFAGIKKDEADDICRQLKSNDISCIAIKN
jgi:tetratricopeptide (TPR) repeat protein